jgi:hypothetical protein
MAPRQTPRDGGLKASALIGVLSEQNLLRRDGLGPDIIWPQQKNDRDRAEVGKDWARLGAKAEWMASPNLRSRSKKRSRSMSFKYRFVVV